MLLGGAHSDDPFRCLQIIPSESKYVRLLKCSHEEADDRILFHINHGVVIQNFESVIVASEDTDVFVGLLHHFPLWAQHDLSELWMVCGKGDNSRAVPIHEIVEVMDASVIEVLPTVHAPSGCDTTSKIGTKKAALRAAFDQGWELLKTFGNSPISDEMIMKAEKFLILCLSNNNEEDFDQLRFNSFHKQAFKMDLEKLPCMTSSIKLHIRRSYLQSNRWIHAPFIESIDLDPLDFGYIISDGDEALVPNIEIRNKLPDDFPNPCTCIKCAKSNVCPCRVKGISCCEFCKCYTAKQCRNPANMLT